MGRRKSAYYARLNNLGKALPAANKPLAYREARKDSMTGTLDASGSASVAFTSTAPDDDDDDDVVFLGSKSGPSSAAQNAPQRATKDFSTKLQSAHTTWLAKENQASRKRKPHYNGLSERTLRRMKQERRELKRKGFPSVLECWGMETVEMQGERVGVPMQYQLEGIGGDFVRMILADFLFG